MKTILQLSFFLLANLAVAQDIIYKISGGTLSTKIIRISGDAIQYYHIDLPDGPVYTIKTTDVEKIIYSNGSEELFKKPKSTISIPEVIDPNSVKGKRLAQYNKVTKTRNVVFFNLLEVLNAGVGFSFFKEVLNHKIDFHIPVSFSFEEPELSNALTSSRYGKDPKVTGYALTKKEFDLGLGIYINTSGKRAITHFIGPLIRYAQFKGVYDVNTYTYTYTYHPEVDFFFFTIPGYTTTETHKTTKPGSFTMNELSLLINNGLLFRINSRINVMLNLATGAYISRTYTAQDGNLTFYNDKDSSYDRKLAVQGGFSFGYRF